MQTKITAKSLLCREMFKRWRSSAGSAEWLPVWIFCVAKWWVRVCQKLQPWAESHLSLEGFIMCPWPPQIWEQWSALTSWDKRRTVIMSPRRPKLSNCLGDTSGWDSNLSSGGLPVSELVTVHACVHLSVWRLCVYTTAFVTLLLTIY